MSDRSAELFRQAQEVLAGGVSRNTLLRSPHPYYVERGEGCRVIDVDGYVGSFGTSQQIYVPPNSYWPAVAPLSILLLLLLL